MNRLLLAAESNLGIDTSETLEAIDKVMDLKPAQIKHFIKGKLPTMISFCITVILALIILFIGTRITKLIRKIIRKSMQRSNIDLGVIQFTDAFVKVVCYVLLFLTIIGMFGVQTTSFIAVFGSAGLAVGLALQGSLANFAGGVLILVLKPFTVGDWIICGSNEGSVTNISLFATKLLTIEKKTVIIPNGELANSTITNVNKETNRLMDLRFDISYNNDIKKAKSVIENVLRHEPDLIHSEGYTIFVDELADHSIKLGARVWVLAEDYWPVRWRILENMKYAFDENQLEIPYDQLDVHVHQ